MTKPTFKDFLPEGLVSNYVDEGRMSDIMIGIEEDLGALMNQGIENEEDQLERLQPTYGSLVTLGIIRQIKADKGDVEPADMYENSPVEESVEVSEIKILTEKLMKR